jgi:hypothetical protein
MVSAALGIAVGGISVILSFITIFACISALVGLGLSLFGLTAKHRGIAVPGIALSSLALAICFFWLLLGLLFAYLQGVAGQGQPPVLY